MDWAIQMKSRDLRFCTQAATGLSEEKLERIPPKGKRTRPVVLDRMRVLLGIPGRFLFGIARRVFSPHFDQDSAP